MTVSALFLWWAARNVDFSNAWDALYRVDYRIYAGSMVLYFLTMLIRALLVSILLSPHGRVTVGNTLSNLILGYFCNNILPFKVGEIVRTGLITRDAKIPFFTGLSALVMERSMDILSLVVIALVTSFFLPLPEQVIISIRVVGAGLLVLYVTVIGLALARRRGWTGPEKLLARLPGRAGTLAVRTLDQLADGLKAFSRPGTFLTTVLLVAMFWVVAISGWYLRLRAFGLADSYAVAPLVILVVGLGISIPSAPSYAGVMHACIVFALGTVGVAGDSSFPFAVFLHAVDFAFVGILGVTVMGMKSMTLGGLRDAARAGGRDKAG
ncbi:MAG: flippase-like domain-containing protein [Deltaproteobacteria bacterium]|nr:flippase-like domain-containing protein [Deltaproteobacteria bacterium]